MERPRLLERYCRDRSPEAAERLVEAYQPLVASVCRRYLRCEQDAEDAAQDTFVKLLHHAGSIRGQVNGWLTTAAYSTCVDLIRRAKADRRRREHAREMLPATEHRFIHEAIHAKLHEALLQLDEAGRELLIERFVRKTPLREIADRREVSVATMSRQTARAVSDLAAVLRDMGVEAADDLTLAEHFGDPANLPPDHSIADDSLRFAPDWNAVRWQPMAAGAASRGACLPGWTRPLRIGAFVSHLALAARDLKGKSHPEHADGWPIREAWLQIGTVSRMVHPGYQLVGIVEAGTSGYGPIEGVLRQYEVFGGLIEAIDVEGLATLDVVLVGNNWVMTPAIARAFHAAVRSGVGLLNDCCWTDLFECCGCNADVRALALAASPTYRFHTVPHETPMRVVIHEAHPVLPGLRPGMEAMAPSCGPVYQVMKGATVLMSRDRVVMPEEHRLAGVGPLRPPLYVVGQLGRGRVAVVNVHAHRRIMMIPGLGSGYMDNLLCWLAEPRREAG